MPHDTANRPHLVAFRVRGGRHGVEVTEELVGAVDEMNVHNNFYRSTFVGEL